VGETDRRGLLVHALAEERDNDGRRRLIVVDAARDQLVLGASFSSMKTSAHLGAIGLDAADEQMSIARAAGHFCDLSSQRAARNALRNSSNSSTRGLQHDQP